MTHAADFRLSFSRDESGAFAGVGVLRLENPGKPVVVLDAELVDRLEHALKALPRDLRGLVLASASERVFVAGADLKAIQELSDADLARYLAHTGRVFGLIAALPYPTVAAINGAALGGGLELAMHCDGLVACPGSKPYPVGLPEAGLSICPGWGGTNLLAARLRDPARALAMTASGQTMMFEDAKEADLFDAVATDASGLLEAAKTWVVAQGGRTTAQRDGAPLRWIGRPGIRAGVLAALDAAKASLAATGPGRAVALAVDAGLSRGWAAALEVEQRELVRLRSTPEGKAAIEAFFAKKK
jgi:enoyl-CoA hydratase/carnithine racemase